MYYFHQLEEFERVLLLAFSYICQSLSRITQDKLFNSLFIVSLPATLIYEVYSPTAWRIEIVCSYWTNVLAYYKANWIFTYFLDITQKCLCWCLLETVISVDVKRSVVTDELTENREWLQKGDIFMEELVASLVTIWRNGL